MSSVADGSTTSAGYWLDGRTKNLTASSTTYAQPTALVYSPTTAQDAQSTPSEGLSVGAGLGVPTIVIIALICVGCVIKRGRIAFKSRTRQQAHVDPVPSIAHTNLPPGTIPQQNTDTPSTYPNPPPYTTLGPAAISGSQAPYSDPPPSYYDVAHGTNMEHSEGHGAINPGLE